MSKKHKNEKEYSPKDMECAIQLLKRKGYLTTRRIDEDVIILKATPKFYEEYGKFKGEVDGK